MRIACPSCNAAYQVPDGQLHEGRVVRCARCGAEWTPIAAVPTEPAPAAAPRVGEELELERDEAQAAPSPGKKMALDDEAPAPTPAAAPAAPAQPLARRRSGLLAVAWVLSIVAVGAAGVGLVIGRERVMTAWAPSIRGYAALGLAGR